MKRDWTPVRMGTNGQIYCSPACGAGCTYDAYLKANSDAEALASVCAKRIGGVWNPRVWENLGWRWEVVQEGTNIAISYGGYLAQGHKYSIGICGSTPMQISLHPQDFLSVDDAYTAQTAAIRNEAARWNDILDVINENITKSI